MGSRIKPKGTVLGEFISEAKRVKAQYKNDNDDWTTIAVCHTSRQAQALATQLNKQLQGIENHG